jgi:hypothetical protein
VNTDTETVSMDAKRENMIYAGLCGLALLGCLATVVWTILAGMVRDIDGLLLILIALSLGGVFQIVLLMIMKDLGWLEKLPLFGKKKPAPPSKDAK